MATEAAWLECKESTGRKSKQKEQTERANRKSKLKEKNTLDSYRPSHGRT
jgi:hypothetical protein